MFGLDEKIAALGSGEAFVLVVAIAVLLGLRHATDPDHLTAVATLIAGDDRHGVRRARALGFAWGAGHALTLFAFGLPVVLVGSALPEAARRAAELAIGALIVALAVRLLVRWRRGAFHTHVHAHGNVRHAHPHAHEHARGHGPEHEHAHAESLGRIVRDSSGDFDRIVETKHPEGVSPDVLAIREVNTNQFAFDAMLVDLCHEWQLVFLSKRTSQPLRL